MVGGVVGGVFGGADTPSAPNVSTFQLPNLDAMTGDWKTLLDKNVANNPAADYSGTAKDIFGATYNNPTAGGYNAAAGAAGNMASNVAALDANNANLVSGAAPGLFSGAATVQNMALDPQQALYNRTLQQLQQQMAVSNSQSGLSSSPYGADLTNEALGNFNIDWQNQQLNRAIAGLGAAGTADTQGASLTNTAAGLGKDATASKLASGAIPYDTSQSINANNSSALTQLISTLTGANTTNQTSLQDILQYLTLGSNQSNEQASLQLQNYQNQLAQAQQAGGGLASLGNALGNFTGLNSMGGSGSPFDLTSLFASMGSSGGSAADAQFLSDAATAAAMA